VIGVGDRVPAARVWVTAEDRDPVPLASLAEEGPFLLLFYLYDWTST
jgi:hypothetical protein